MTARGEGWRVGVKKVKGLKRYKPPAIKQVSHGDVIHNVRTVVSNIVILYRDGWLLDIVMTIS